MAIEQIEKPGCYMAELRQDQWDLIVLVMEHVRKMTTGAEGTCSVDQVGRKFLRRCIDEVVTDIRAQVPKSSAE